MNLEPSAADLAELTRSAEELEDATPQEVLRWAFDTYDSEITLACSFGGPTGMALLDMSTRLRADVSVFYLDTDLLFPETYVLVEEVKRRYGIEPVAYRSRWSLDSQAKEFGEALWSKDPDLCCAVRKVEPNGRALEGYSAWIAGLRRDQTDTRKTVSTAEWDAKFGLVKINPLATWSEEQVWDYIRANDVPHNALHEQGYPSIGCIHCTRAVLPGEDPRAGRWSGTDKDECGLHIDGVEIAAELGPVATQ
jgi:phosphoadenosine phosphosulfate reductase